MPQKHGFDEKQHRKAFYDGDFQGLGNDHFGHPETTDIKGS